MDRKILTNPEKAMAAAMTVIRNHIGVGNQEDRPHIQRNFNQFRLFISYEIMLNFDI